jgi:hypothetical protein
MKNKIQILVGLFLGFTLHLSAQQSTEKITVPLRFDHYYTYEQVVEAMKALNAAYPTLTTLDLVGKSEENREIWAMTINNSKTGDPLDKPGVYLDGNIHGNEIQATEVCLYFMDYMLKKYGENDKITKLLDKNAYYIIPVVNVDGRYHFFADANTPSSNRGLRIPRDDDRDGLFDEDFPDDLNGDGNISTMRKKDPFGYMKTDPEDARLMMEVKPGEKGEWVMLGEEGIDNDEDGRINEDAEGYVDGNRNWGYNWAPDYVQSGSGDFPFQGKGIKAISDYIMKRPNIIIVYAFHNNGGMYLRGPGTKDQPEFQQGDLKVFDYLGKNNESIVPGYRYLLSWKDLYATYGDFCEFTDNVLGAYSFVGELFQTSTETYKTAEAKPQQPAENEGFREDPERARERLKFNDNVVQGDLYTDWKPYKHPLYGDIEIGGWVKMSSRLPHPFMLPDLVHRNASAVMFSAEQTPEVKMEVFDTKKIGKDLYRVRVRLSNAKAMPSLTYNAIRKKIQTLDIVKLSGKNIKVVSGGKLTDPYNEIVNYKKDKPEVQFCQVPGFGKIEYQFLVSGNGALNVDYQSLKAGKRQEIITLK